MRACPLFVLILVFFGWGLVSPMSGSGVPEEEKPAVVEKKEKPRAKKEAVAGKASEKEKDKEQENTVTLKGEELKIEVELDGVVEGTKSTAIAMNLDRWTELVVVSVVPHGTFVKEGDSLIELETEKLEEKIEELEQKLPVDELELQMAQRALEKLEKTTPLSLENARRAKLQAEEDLAYFEDITKPMRERDAKEDVKTTGDYLAYAEEELNQLKKMYEKDDLTEETEEIILKRAQNTVNSYRWMLEQTKTRSDRTVNTDLPRQHEQLKSDLELRQLNWRAGEQASRDSLEKARFDFEAKKRAFDESKEALDEYKKDYAAMQVKAPHDGIVYYGMSQRGKWTTASTVERKLIPGGKLTMREVFLTVVDPDMLQLRVSIPEGKLKDLKEGQNAVVELQWNDEEEIGGKLESVSYVPFSNNTYDAVIAFSEEGEKPKMYPGMNAKAAVTTYLKKDALLVPKNAVHRKDEKRHVILLGGKKQPVELGHEKGDKVEVVKGVKAGDKVVLPKVEGEKAPDKEKDKEQEKDKEGEEK
ncbi:MAG: hypothetical protein CMO55_24790 [Verrucomicrobiales bacterium]|nr:hypothetical protein [Verrucomicrobiales bacterium]